MYDIWCSQLCVVRPWQGIICSVVITELKKLKCVELVGWIPFILDASYLIAYNCQAHSRCSINDEWINEWMRPKENGI